MEAAVIEVLRQAVSQDPNVLKSAEETLKQWETQQGFYIALYVSLSPVSFFFFTGYLLCISRVRTGFMERHVG